MEFSALTRIAFSAGALLLCLVGAGCASPSPESTPQEIEAFQGKPMPESVRAKMRASRTATPAATTGP